MSGSMKYVVGGASAEVARRRGDGYGRRRELRRLRPCAPAQRGRRRRQCTDLEDVSSLHARLSTGPGGSSRVRRNTNMTVTGVGRRVTSAGRPPACAVPWENARWGLSLSTKARFVMSDLGRRAFLKVASGAAVVAGTRPGAAASPTGQTAQIRSRDVDSPRAYWVNVLRKLSDPSSESCGRYAEGAHAGRGSGGSIGSTPSRDASRSGRPVVSRHCTMARVGPVETATKDGCALRYGDLAPRDCRRGRPSIT